VGSMAVGGAGVPPAPPLAPSLSISMEYAYCWTKKSSCVSGVQVFQFPKQKFILL